jgi:hypothetical protein
MKQLGAFVFYFSPDLIELAVHFYLFSYLILFSILSRHEELEQLFIDGSAV